VTLDDLVAGKLKCEVCGGTAAHMVADMRELPSETGWKHWEVHSRHLLCDAHNRPPLEYLLDGRVECAPPPPVLDITEQE
jgi:hypothetical protein